MTTVFLIYNRVFISGIKHLLFIFICLSPFACKGIAETKTGVIIDSVRCKNNPVFSYALYLPENYSDSINWPVIYVFDPAARGKLGLTNFIQAAKQYGYILACSNNSKNGIPVEALNKIINALTNDIESNYSIDYNRIYTSGFSGGSRVASMIALNSSQVIGVIGCGAGFPNSVIDLGMPRFDYYGLVGDRDMNYVEMCDLKKRLDNLGISSELKIFEGGHVWPSPDLLQEAIEWMELQAMNKGIKQKNPAFVNSQFEKKENEAVMLLNQGKVIESVDCIKYISDWFPEHIKTVQLEKKSDSIQQTKDYKKAIKKWKEIQIEELVIQQMLMTEMKNISLMELLPDSMRNWWSTQINTYKKIESGSDVNKQNMAFRQLNFLAAACYETARNCMTLKQFKTAAIYYQIASMVQPENNNVYYQLARTYAFDKDTKNSLKYLEKAIKTGYNDKKSIENESAFLPLSKEKKFQDIMEQLK